jgi:hypothetical protein
MEFAWRTMIGPIVLHDGAVKDGFLGAGRTIQYLASTWIGGHLSAWAADHL